MSRKKTYTIAGRVFDDKAAIRHALKEIQDRARKNHLWIFGLGKFSKVTDKDDRALLADLLKRRPDWQEKLEELGERPSGLAYGQHPKYSNNVLYLSTKSNPLALMCGTGGVIDALKPDAVAEQDGDN